LVFAVTAFSRMPGEHYNYKLILFWSYKEILGGNKYLLFLAKHNIEKYQKNNLQYYAN
jgi:hypothetical protein